MKTDMMSLKQMLGTITIDVVSDTLGVQHHTAYKSYKAYNPNHIMFDFVLFSTA